METRIYDVTELDALVRQYAALSVEHELFEHITCLRAELEGAIMFTFPLKVDESAYRIPHFAVVTLATESEQREDEFVLRQYFVLREFNSEAFPDGQPVKELKLINVPFDFDGKLWMDQVNRYIYDLERARRETEIDNLDD